MAKQWLVNQTPVNAEAPFNLKATLLAAGWTAVRGGRGTGRGYYASSDPWATAANARGAGAWIVLQSPDGSKQLLMHRYPSSSDDPTYDRYWSMWLSTKDTSGFDGGTPDEDSRATATDEHQLFNGMSGGGWPASGSFRMHIMAEDAAPYGWWTVSYPNGGAAYPSHMAFMDPMTAYPLADVDPYVHFFDQSIGYSSFSSEGAQNPQCHLLKGLGGEGFVRMAMLKYSTNNDAFPFGAQGLGANPFDAKDDVVPVLYGRTSAQSAPIGFKGVSTLFKYTGAGRSLGDALTVNTARDHLYLGKYLPIVEWDGSVPLV